MFILIRGCSNKAGRKRAAVYVLFFLVSAHGRSILVSVKIKITL